MSFLHNNFFLFQVLSLVDEVCQENNIKENCSEENGNAEDGSEEVDRTSDISGYHSGSDCNNLNNSNKTSPKTGTNLATTSSDCKVTSKMQETSKLNENFFLSNTHLSWICKRYS